MPDHYDEQQMDALGALGIQAPTADLVNAPKPIGGEIAPVNYGSPPEVARMTSGYGSFEGYYEGQETEILRSLSTEQRARLQEQMVALGLTSRVVYGEVDDGTIAGFRSLLAMSNQKRERWQSTLSRIVTRAEQEGVFEDAPTEVYRPPNYEAAAQDIKTMFKDYLRRDPTEAELALLGEKLMSLHRQGFDDDVAATDMQADNVGAGRVIEGPAQRNYMAEFRAHMEQKFAGEREVVEDVDERQQATQMTNTIADSLGSIIGGGA